MQFKPFEPGIEVNGQTVFSIVDGFGAFTLIASKYLLAEGIGEPGDGGVVRIRVEAWYSQEAWLRAFERISNEMGDSALHLIGMKIPENAKFPPWVNDLDSAIKSVDVAYHLNHRKNGKELFNLATGQMSEGIGHYGYERLEGQKRIVSVCNNPYPCAFDRGILTAMARRFEHTAQVEHAADQPCRKKGAESCTYRISW